MIQSTASLRTQLQHLRLSFQGHHLQSQQIAGISQQTPAQAAHTTGATGDKTTKTCGAPGAWGQPERPTLWLQLAI